MSMKLQKRCDVIVRSNSSYLEYSNQNCNIGEVKMTKVTYSIPNISCGHCVHTIKMEVSELAGVIEVEANAGNKQATIVFEPPATEEQIQRLLTEINYPVAS